MTRWLRADVLGAALTSLALAMLAVGTVLAAPAVGLADDGAAPAPPVAIVVQMCDNTACTKNKPGSCQMNNRYGVPCPFTVIPLCTLLCKTINGANYPEDLTDQYCDCGA